MTRSAQVHAVAWVVVCGWLVCCPAAGQDPAALAELEKLFKSIVKPDTLPAVKDAAAAHARVAELNLPPDKLQPPQQIMLLRTGIHAAAGCGQAAAAGERAEKLRNLGTALDAAALESVILGAVVAGDAKLADDALQELAKLPQAKTRSAVEQRRARLAQVGEPAPEQAFVTEDSDIVELAPRGGVVLLLDFWNIGDKPSDAHVKALRALRDAHRTDGKLLVVGINADGPDRLEEARRFVQTSKMDWPQHFEEIAAGAPLTHETFQAGRGPWQVLIDKTGHIRAVGSAEEAAFRAAVLAAVTEARGDAVVEMPRNVQGRKAELREAPPVVHSSANKSAGGKLPSNPEAASMLREARAFLKTGMKTKAHEILRKIIEQYPGTQEAEDAKFLLG